MYDNNDDRKGLSRTENSIDLAMLLLTAKVTNRWQRLDADRYSLAQLLLLLL